MGENNRNKENENNVLFSHKNKYYLKGNLFFKAEMSNLRDLLGPGFFNQEACLFGRFSSYSPRAA